MVINKGINAEHNRVGTSPSKPWRLRKLLCCIQWTLGTWIFQCLTGTNQRKGYHILDFRFYQIKLRTRYIFCAWIDQIFSFNSAHRMQNYRKVEAEAGGMFCFLNWTTGKKGK